MVCGGMTAPPTSRCRQDSSMCRARHDLGMANGYDFRERDPREGGGLSSGDLPAPRIALSGTFLCDAEDRWKGRRTVMTPMRRPMTRGIGSGDLSVSQADRPVKDWQHAFHQMLP